MQPSYIKKPTPTMAQFIQQIKDSPVHKSLLEYQKSPKQQFMMTNMKRQARHQNKIKQTHNEHKNNNGIPAFIRTTANHSPNEVKNQPKQQKNLIIEKNHQTRLNTLMDKKAKYPRLSHLETNQLQAQNPGLIKSQEFKTVKHMFDKNNYNPHQSYGNSTTTETHSQPRQSLTSQPTSIKNNNYLVSHSSQIESKVSTQQNYQHPNFVQQMKKQKMDMAKLLAEQKTKNAYRPQESKQEDFMFKKNKTNGFERNEKFDGESQRARQSLTYSGNLDNPSSLTFHKKLSVPPKKATNNSFNQFTHERKNSVKKLQISDFVQKKQLGSGHYGKVILAIHKYTGFVCAIKIVPKNVVIEENIVEQFIRQIKIQTFLDHPNVLRMYGIFDDRHNIYLLIQPCLDHNLFSYMQKNKKLSEYKIALIMKQICHAVNKLHSEKIIHRDLKPQNIMMHENVLKLGDFGWSVYMDNKLRNTFCGTPLYVCPEMLRGIEHDEKVDVWAVGIILYELLVGENPFKITCPQQMAKIIVDEVKIPSSCKASQQAQDFLDECLKKSSRERIGIGDLLQHEFFTKNPDKHAQKNKYYNTF